jgi:adenylate cyclase
LLDPELPVGHYMLAFVNQIRGDLRGALAAARRSIELDPSFSTAYRQLGFILAEAGESEEAIAVFEQGMRLSPHDPWLSEFIRGKSHAYFASRRYGEAAESARESIAQGAPLYLAWFALAASEAHLGNIEEAEVAFQEGTTRMSEAPTATEFRRMYSYWHPDFLERYIDGLRKAGLPE